MVWTKQLLVAVVMTMAGTVPVAGQFAQIGGEFSWDEDFSELRPGRRNYDPEEVPTPMQKAVAQGRLQEVRTLLEDFPNAAGQRYLVGPHPLVMAVHTANAEMVDLLLEHGADANLRDSETGESLITRSALIGEPLIVELLLAKEPRIEFTTIHRALEGKDSSTLALLLAARPEWGPRELGDRLLTTAAESGNPGLVSLLLERGFDPNQPPPGGDDEGHYVNPLQAAVFSENYSVVRMLLAAGCTQEVLDASLGISVRDGTREITRLLLEEGGRPDGQMIAQAAMADHFPMLRMLIDYGADPNTEAFGSSLLEHAIHSGGHRTLAYLLKMGARPPEDMGQPPLAAAERADPEAVAKRLVDLNQAWATFVSGCKRGDIDEVRRAVLLKPSVTRETEMVSVPPREAGEDSYIEITGLGAAAVFGHTEVVAYLAGLDHVDLEARCDLPGRAYSYTGTALHLAVYSRDLPTIEALLTAGANPQPRRFGLTDLDQWVNDHADNREAVIVALGAARERWNQWHERLRQAIRSDDVDGFAQEAAGRAWYELVDDAGRTLTHEAAAAGRRTILAWMLEHGGDPAQRDGDGRNAVHHALLNHHADLATWLVAQPYSADDLVRALWQNDREAVARLLEGFGRWERLSQPYAGYLPLHVAVATGVPELVDLVLEAGAEPLAPTADGRTALELARLGGDELKALETRLFGRALAGKRQRTPIVQRLEQAESRATTVARNLFDTTRSVRMGGELLGPGNQYVEVDMSLYAWVNNEGGWRIRELELRSEAGRVEFRHDPREGTLWTLTPPVRTGPRQVFRSEQQFREAHGELFDHFRQYIDQQLRREIGSELQLGGPLEPDSRKILLGVNVTTTGEGGVSVRSVVPRSNAAAAGVQTGDLVTAVNDVQVHEPEQLGQLLGWFEPGDRFELTILRGGVTERLTVHLRPQAE